ncbi:MAG: hypothetical protein QOF21_299 [Actinomycetota bacterium]
MSIAADGSETTWWSGDRRAYNRPQQMRGGSRVGEGFSDGGLVLPRDMRRDYHDISLYDTVVMVGDDGEIAYEGRIGATPRSTAGGHSIALQLAGWMAHARDRKFKEIYNGRDLSAWGPTSTTRRGALLSGGTIFRITGSGSVVPDSSGFPALQLQIDRMANVAGPPITRDMAEAWFDARGVPIGSVYYDVVTYNQDGATFGSDTWKVFVGLANDDLANDDLTATLRANAAGTLVAGGTDRTFANVQMYYDATNTEDGPFQAFFRNLAIVGTHGLTKRGTGPGGFFASDMLKDVAARFCPKLSTAGVEDTDLVIPHAAFLDRTHPYEAFLIFNGPHGYELAVWEGKELTFRPYDLSKYDWQVFTDQPGVDVELQGDTTQDLANYAVVEFDNVNTGRRDSVGPEDSADLEDTSVDHPANMHGLDAELTIGLTFPADQELAIKFGRSYLAEFNRPKNRGQIKVAGHIQDGAGHWNQYWKPRYGQTIGVLDHENDAPRLITEAKWDVASESTIISTDNGEVNGLEAMVDYVYTSLKARGLAG